MSQAARFQRVMALFQQACSLDEPARADLLARECLGDEVLRGEVQAMLDQDAGGARTLSEAGAGARLLARAVAAEDEHVREGGEHDHGNAGEIAGTWGSWSGPYGARRGLPHASPAVPVLAGQYRILRVIGEGGMGIVYLAQQARPRRLVALKALRPGTTSRDMLRRFEHEAQILGRLQHPGIAQIYEAGAATADAPHQAYFAMEFVAGQPLTEYADARGLEVRQRVELMLRVCDAVEHAHQRGVIHRDLKPGNILVQEGAADGPKSVCPVPKILDFGVALTLDGDPNRDNSRLGTPVDPHVTTMHTHAGQLVGTLAYMSPEQVAGESGSVDTRSDIYALGVMLYQLLAGRLPLDFARQTLPEAARMIREVEPPRLGAVHRSLRGDLEVIVAKAMEKDAARRYQSVADLRGDLARYLEGLPIDAKRDSAMYVLRKHLGRHRAAVMAGVAALLGLMAFAVYAFIAAQRNAELAEGEKIARSHAEQQRDRADRAVGSLQHELAVNAIERGRLLGQTGNLAAAEDLLWAAELRQPGSRHVHWALWELYSRLPCAATFDSGIAALRSIAVAPGGGSAAFGADNGRVQIWTMNPWQRAMASETGGKATPALAYSPDGALLASPIDGKDIALWETSSLQSSGESSGQSSLQRRGTLVGHQRDVRSLAWSPDNRLLASMADDGTLRVWDVAALQCVTVLNIAAPASGQAALAPNLSPPPLVFAPNNRTIAWSGIDRVIRVCRNCIRLESPATGEPASAADTPIILSGHSDFVSCLAFSPDSQTLYSGGADRDIREWDLDAAECRRVLVAPNGTIRALQVSRDGQRLLSAGWWTFDIWDLAAAKRVRSIGMPVGAMFARWSDDESQVTTAHGDGTLRMWDLGPAVSAVYHDHSGRSSAAFSADGLLIASGDAAGKIIVRERDGGSIRWSIGGHRARIYSLRFTPDGALLATAGADGFLRLWDVRSGEMRGEIRGVNAVSQDSLGFSPDGSLLAATWNDGTFRLLAIPSLEQRLTFARATTESLATRFSPDGKSIVTVSRDRGVALWNIDGSPIRAMPLETSAWTCAFSADGRVLVAGTWSKALMMWETATGLKIATLGGHNGLPSGIAFDPADAGVVASAAADGRVCLWDTGLAQTGAAPDPNVGNARNLLSLDAFDNTEAITVDISADGRWLLSASADGTVKAWDLHRFDRHIEGNRAHQMRLHSQPR